MEKEMSGNLNCVYNTINLIAQNYDQVITIQQLEEVSHYSYRNIQRIFRFTCGETIGSYQKRLRVENAYKMMLYTTDPIASIALKVGFANVASFSKAFKQHFGMAPREAKGQKQPLLAKAAIFPVENPLPLKPEIIYIPAITVYYTSAFINYIAEEIEPQWELFMQNSFPVNGNEFYGIIADEPLLREKLSCRYDTCASQPSLTRKLSTKTIAGGKYAQFSHYGSYDTIEETYSQIYAGWILTNKLEFAPSPIIEKYIRHPDNTGIIEEQLTYIWLPLA